MHGELTRVMQPHPLLFAYKTMRGAGGRNACRELEWSEMEYRHEQLIEQEQSSCDDHSQDLD